ncbi:unnamed protein product, partial [Rotaria sordida]
GVSDSQLSIVAEHELAQIFETVPKIKTCYELKLAVVIENQGSSGQRRGDGTGDKEVLNTANKLAEVLPYRHCHLKQLRFERIKDNLLLEEEFIKNQERLKPQEDRHEA